LEMAAAATTSEAASEAAAIARFSVGALFDTKEDIVKAHAQYTLAVGRQYFVTQSTPTRFAVCCGQFGAFTPPPVVAAAPAPSPLMSPQQPTAAPEEQPLPSAATQTPRHRGRTKMPNANRRFSISATKQNWTQKWRDCAHTAHTCPESARKVILIFCSPPSLLCHGASSM